MKTTTKLTLLVALTGSMLAAAAAAAAAPAPEDAAKYRQSVMKALSGHNGAIAMIVRGKAGNADNLASHIQALVNLKDETASVFAEGSDLDDDEALPAIWTDADAFAVAIKNFDAAVEALSEAAGGGDMQALDAAHREVGKSCKGCHEDFRQKKED
jgi:cytochrome c556